MYINMPNNPKMRAFSSASSDDYNTFDILRNRIIGTAYNSQQRQKLRNGDGDNAPAECSPIETIIRENDGGLFDDWQLLGVLLLLRHGDRGPMVHVRNVNAINCGAAANAPAVERYRSFLANATMTSGSSSSSGNGGGPVDGRPSWPKTGPFHGNPLLPTYPSSCLLGQLTYK